MTCLRVDQQNGKFIVYIAEMSTAQALGLFDPSDSAEVVHCAASTSNGAQWITAQDLAHFLTVGDICKFIADREDVYLIDISIRIGSGIGSNSELSTHDDGEAHFLVSTRQAAVELIRRAVKPEYAASALEAAAKNPGKYLDVQDASVRVFQSFDEYLRRAEN